MGEGAAQQYVRRIGVAGFRVPLKARSDPVAQSRGSACIASNFTQFGRCG